MLENVEQCTSEAVGSASTFNKTEVENTSQTITTTRVVTFQSSTASNENRFAGFTSDDPTKNFEAHDVGTIYTFGFGWPLGSLASGVKLVSTNGCGSWGLKRPGHAYYSAIMYAGIPFCERVFLKTADGRLVEALGSEEARLLYNPERAAEILAGKYDAKLGEFKDDESESELDVIEWRKFETRRLAGTWDYSKSSKSAIMKQIECVLTTFQQKGNVISQHHQHMQSFECEERAERCIVNCEENAKCDSLECEERAERGVIEDVEDLLSATSQNACSVSKLDSLSDEQRCNASDSDTFAEPPHDNTVEVIKIPPNAEVLDVERTATTNNTTINKHVHVYNFFVSENRSAQERSIVKVANTDELLDAYGAVRTTEKSAELTTLLIALIYLTVAALLLADDLLI